MAGTSSHPKTAFLVAHQGFHARYLLRTDILRTLLEAGVNVVVLTPNADEEYMRRELAGAGVAVEPLQTSDLHPAGHWLSKRAWGFLHHARHYMVAYPDECLAFRQKYERFHAKYRGQRPLRARAIHGLLAVAWRSARVRRALLGAETRLFNPALHAELFERHRPDLVVTPSPGYFKPDAAILREARARGVATAAIVTGWDNPTSKGYRGADPDRIVVWSDRMAGQIERHHDYPRERTFVGGVPHFDRYVREGALPGREELLPRLGLDPGRRLIVFATSTPGYYADNLAVARTLAEAISTGALSEPAQLVVRLHPGFFRPGLDDPTPAYEALAAEHDHVHLDVPEVRSQALRCDMPGSDDLRVQGLVRHADVLVNVFSTTSLEAFLVDTPVVMVASRALDYQHMQALLEDGAAPVAHSMEEVVSLVRRYLAEPALERDARKRIARTECGPTDGHAGERIGGLLLDLMGLPALVQGGAPAGDTAPALAPAGPGHA